MKNSTLQEVLFLYKKQYGRMTVRAWLNMEMENSHPAFMVGGGILLLIAGLIVRFSVGGPYRVMMELGIADVVPPVWLMGILWSLSLFLIGCAAGFVLAYRPRGCEAEKYKGCMLFILLSVLELCWYPAFFGAGLVFVSVLMSLLILCLSVWITGCFYRVTKLGGMLLLLHSVWLIYMVILHFIIFFRA